MHLDELREYCINKKGVEEGFPFGGDTLVFKVMGKIFLLSGIDSQPVQFNAKCDPEKAIELRENYPCVLPGYHMNKKLWNTVLLDGSVPGTLVRELIDHSYELIRAKSKKPAPKK